MPPFLSLYTLNQQGLVILIIFYSLHFQCCKLLSFLEQIFIGHTPV